MTRLSENHQVEQEAATESRGLGRIGVVVPYTNINLEPDLVALRPSGVSLHFTRIQGYDRDEVPDSGQMREFGLTDIDETIYTLTAARPHVVLYGCTSSTLSHGTEFDRQLAGHIQSLAGVPAVTAAGALVESLVVNDIDQIAFASPYVESLHHEAIQFLSEYGIETVSEARVPGDLSNHEQGQLTPAKVFELGLRADSPQAQALVISCTDIRAVEAIDTLRSALGKPVITSNQALMSSAVTRLEALFPPAEIR